MKDEIKTLSQLLELLSKGYIISSGTINPPLSKKAAPELHDIERSFCITVAGHTAAIYPRYGEIFSLCKEYLSNSEPEIFISVTDADLDFERNRENDCNISWSNSYLESLSILRKISESMLSFDTFLMHGAVIAINNEAFMFTANSGIGKTTHIKKWLDNIKTAYVVNGDKPLIRIAGNQVIACGTPWCGKEKMGTNIMTPLKSIVLMERGDTNVINEISFGEAYVFLLHQTYMPSNHRLIVKTLELLSRLNGKVRFYKFVFNNLKDDAFLVSYNCLMNQFI